MTLVGYSLREAANYINAVTFRVLECLNMLNDPRIILHELFYQVQIYKQR